jgi:hypothetical protein
VKRDSLRSLFNWLRGEQQLVATAPEASYVPVDPNRALDRINLMRQVRTRRAARRAAELGVDLAEVCEAAHAAYDAIQAARANDDPSLARDRFEATLYGLPDTGLYLETLPVEVGDDMHEVPREQLDFHQTELTDVHVVKVERATTGGPTATLDLRWTVRRTHAPRVLFPDGGPSTIRVRERLTLVRDGPGNWVIHHLGRMLAA